LVYLSTPADTSPDVAAPRRPQQERGQRRVDAILDAAAALVADVGVEGLTVAAIAERAQTSKGSMYHFFPDLDAVVRALAERHVTSVRALADEVRSANGDVWTSLPADQVVDRIMAPLERYMDAHPEVPLVMRSPANQARVAAGGASGLTVIAELITSVLAVRTPDVPAGTLAARASAMVAILQAMKAAQPAAGCSPQALRGELRRALGAYLDAAERGAA
jgi:AcrR family transcriptional regulator